MVLEEAAAAASNCNGSGSSSGGSSGSGSAGGRAGGDHISQKAVHVSDLLSSFADLVPRHEAELRRLLHPPHAHIHSPEQQEATAKAKQWRALAASLLRILEDDNDSSGNGGAAGGKENGMVAGAITAAAATPAAGAPLLPAAASSSLSPVPTPPASSPRDGGVAPSQQPEPGPASFSPSSSLTSHPSCSSAASSPLAVADSSGRDGEQEEERLVDAVCASLAAASLKPPPATLAHQHQHQHHQSPVATVLASSDLLHTIIAYLVQAAPVTDARSALNDLSLVSRRFRSLSGWDEWWRPVAVGLLPVLGVPVPVPAAAAGGGKEKKGQGGKEQAGGGSACLVDANYRSYLLRYGRSLLDRRAWMGEALEDGLTLGFEVWDASDGLRMLSASGPIRVQIDQAGGFTSLRIGGANRREAPGPAFSAASRDPTQRRFASMEDYFARGHLPEFSTALCVRVTVTDDRTGRMALLWSTKKDAAYLTEAPLAYWEPYLTDGAISVFLDHWSPLMCPAYDGESMTVTIGFHVCPEPDQPEDTPEQEQLYRLAGGDVERYEEHQSYISITFMTLNTNGIHQFFRALLNAR